MRETLGVHVRPESVFNFSGIRNKLSVLYYRFSIRSQILKKPLFTLFHMFHFGTYDERPFHALSRSTRLLCSQQPRITRLFENNDYEASFIDSFKDRL
jgi:hypothetical protein